MFENQLGEMKDREKELGRLEKLIQKEFKKESKNGNRNRVEELSREVKNMTKQREEINLRRFEINKKIMEL